MCGIVGFVDTRNNNFRLKEILSKMTEPLAHRGPDDSGMWIDLLSGVALGHRRLSIIDLSEEGRQPMVSSDSRYVIIFNGEIYNFREIRCEIEKGEDKINPQWRGHSDTEVMLAAISAWGLEEALHRFNGMFAFALWDKKNRVLHLARDRMGEKPLYYGRIKDVFVFGSELKAFKAHPLWQGGINRDALALFLRHNYIPAPYTIYTGINKLLPGTLLSYSLPDNYQKEKCWQIKNYWSPKELAEIGQSEPFRGTAKEAVIALDQLLLDAVRLRMESDVPLGAFLSGGIDSSTVVALMQTLSCRPVKTFTIGFNESGYNEAESAKLVAAHLGTEHTELYVTSEHAMAIIPQLPTLYDEPFSDSSQIPTFLVSRLARQSVTVSLSGDGGDELFGGYPRYKIAHGRWKSIGWLPLSGRKALANKLSTIPPKILNDRFAWIAPLLYKNRGPGSIADKLYRFVDMLRSENPEIIYKGLVSHWESPANIVLDANEPPTIFTDGDQCANLNNFIKRMMFIDTVSFLPDDILVKVDRASMGVSLEARVPMLDHRVVEFAFRLPLSMKIRKESSKWILQQVLYKYFPEKLFDRPKMGFGVPIGSWLRGPLRCWAEDLLNESKLQKENFFNPEPIRNKWKEHLSGTHNWQYHLWDILMFQAWLDSN